MSHLNTLMDLFYLINRTTRLKKRIQSNATYIKFFFAMSEVLANESLLRRFACLIQIYTVFYGTHGHKSYQCYHEQHCYLGY
jgi:hypothetical protein